MSLRESTVVNPFSRNAHSIFGSTVNFDLSELNNTAQFLRIVSWSTRGFLMMTRISAVNPETWSQTLFGLFLRVHSAA